MTQISEIAPDVFRISTFVPVFNLQFNQFLIRDEEPLLFHTGLKALFPAVREAVSTLLDPARIRWIGFSHLEADECGTLREWQTLVPGSTAVCSLVGKLVSIDDFMAVRPAKGMTNGEVLSTGKFCFRFLHTPHVPHCWEAGLLFEETQRTLFCSDLFHQNGDVEPLTQSDVMGRCRQALVEGQQGPLANYTPYSAQTDAILHRLAALQPKTLATMHGSTFVGDGERAIEDLAAAFRDILGTCE
jgi:flavorubredoxin